MTTDQKVDLLALGMSRVWNEAPCWRRLARYVLETHLGDAKPKEEEAKVYRILQEGDYTQAGDEVNLQGKWTPLPDDCLDLPIQHSKSPVLPAGYYRREVIEGEACPEPEHDWSWAVRQLREGNHVRRNAWCECLFLSLCEGDEVLDDTLLLADDACGRCSAYVADHEDLLATDWEVCDG